MLRKAFLLLFACMGISHAAVYTSSTTVWYVHVLGSTMAAGGYDPSMPSAGTNYADQDSTQAYLTDLITNMASDKALSSASANFTANYIGNSILISTAVVGTNFTNGYYFIISVLTSTAVVVDRAVSTAGGAGSAGMGFVGGAWLDFRNAMVTGAGQPVHVVPPPLSAGQTIKIKGSGSLDPGTTDYDWSAGYWGPGVAGTNTAGAVHILGYNGRPSIYHANALVLSPSLWDIQHIKLVNKGGGTVNGGPFYQGFAGSFHDNIVDLNGQDAIGIFMGGTAISGNCYKNEFRNSGTKTAGTSSQAMIRVGGYPNNIYGNYIHDGRAEGIYAVAGTMGSIYNNVISSCAKSGVFYTGVTSHAQSFHHNTIDSNKLDGIRIDNRATISIGHIVSNILSNNVGFGINYTVGDSSSNYNIQGGLVDFNDFWNNSSGSYANMNPGTHDLVLNPTYTNPTNGTSSDWTPTNTSLNAGFPGSFTGSATVGYTYIGAVTPVSTGTGGTKGATYAQ